jgi:hypothetical protein
LRTRSRCSRTEAVRPHRADGHGRAWSLLDAHRDELKDLLDQDLTVVKAGELLARRGVVVPQWTLHQYALEVLGHGRAARRGVTVQVADGEPDQCAYYRAVVTMARSADHPACSVCVQDEIYDQAGRHPPAAVRVEVCREPYVLRLCEHHLAQLRRVLPAGGVQVVQRY